MLTAVSSQLFGPIFALCTHAIDDRQVRTQLEEKRKFAGGGWADGGGKKQKKGGGSGGGGSGVGAGMEYGFW